MTGVMDRTTLYWALSEYLKNDYFRVGDIRRASTEEGKSNAKALKQDNQYISLFKGEGAASVLIDAEKLSKIKMIH